jgi:hypothetical protein
MARATGEGSEPSSANPAGTLTAGWAALPLAGAALNFSIAYLDITVARSAPLRT